MTDHENGIRKTLHQLVVIGIALQCIRSLLVYADFVTKYPRYLISYSTSLSISILISIFIFIKLGQYKNWARRLLIGLFFVHLPMSFYYFGYFSGPAHFPAHAFLASVDKIVVLLQYLFGFVIVYFLFKSKVRLLFTSQAAKLHRQILFGILALLAGIGVTVGCCVSGLLFNPSIKWMSHEDTLKFKENYYAQIKDEPKKATGSNVK